MQLHLMKRYLILVIDGKLENFRVKCSHSKAFRQTLNKKNRHSENDVKPTRLRRDSDTRHQKKCSSFMAKKESNQSKSNALVFNMIGHFFVRSNLKASLVDVYRYIRFLAHFHRKFSSTYFFESEKCKL